MAIPRNMASCGFPTEILSEIVSLALAKERDNNNAQSSTSNLFHPSKSELRILEGMLMACRRFRAIVLREWFRILRVSVSDWDYISEQLQFDVLSSTRDIYCLDYGMKSIQFVSKFSAIRSVSFPIGPCFSSISSFPPSLEVLEFREINEVTSGLLISIAQAMPCLRSLRIDCGGGGPDQPITADCQKTARELGHEFADALRPLTKLMMLSLDVSLTPLGYPTGHDESCEYRCKGCWDVKKEESSDNEIAATEALAMGLPSLQSVEWACWLRDPKEVKNKIDIIRGDSLSFKPTTVQYRMYPA